MSTGPVDVPVVGQVEDTWRAGGVALDAASAELEAASAELAELRATLGGASDDS